MVPVIFRSDIGSLKTSQLNEPNQQWYELLEKEDWQADKLFCPRFHSMFVLNEFRLRNAENQFSEIYQILLLNFDNHL